jgi:hypothetical protein
MEEFYGTLLHFCYTLLHNVIYLIEQLILAPIFDCSMDNTCLRTQLH